MMILFILKRGDTEVVHIQQIDVVLKGCLKSQPRSLLAKRSIGLIVLIEVVIMSIKVVVDSSQNSWQNGQGLKPNSTYRITPNASDRWTIDGGTTLLDFHGGYSQGWIMDGGLIGIPKAVPVGGLVFVVWRYRGNNSWDAEIFDFPIGINFQEFDVGSDVGSIYFTIADLPGTFRDNSGNCSVDIEEVPCIKDYHFEDDFLVIHLKSGEVIKVLGKPNAISACDPTPNGCSFVPNFDIKDICDQHDRDYARGGTEKDREIADQKFRQAIIDRGNGDLFHVMVGNCYYAGTRLFGGPGYCLKNEQGEPISKDTNTSGSSSAGGNGESSRQRPTRGGALQP
jgi:hypothetical protein